jgi:hypothetical protein
MTTHYITGSPAGGSSRLNRVNASLNPASCKLDELSMSDYITIIVKLAETIPFYNHHGKREGTWRKLVLHNETILLYYLAGINTGKLTDEFFSIYYKAKTEFSQQKKDQLVRSMVQYMIDRVTDMNEWYSIISLAERNTAALEEFQSLAEDMKNTIADLRVLSEKYSITFNHFGEDSNGWYAKLATIWREGSTSGNSLTDRNHRFDINASKRLYNSITDGLYRITGFASRYYEKALQSAGHTPHIGLLLSFLQLFRHNQAHLNGLTKKHLDFYYNDVLKMSLPQYQPDSVHVCFRTAKLVDEYMVEKGTLLAAGKYDNGEDILFRTEEDLLVNKTDIAAVKTIFIGKNPKLDTGTSQQIVTKLYSAGIEKDLIENPDVAWPAFGVGELDNTSAIPQQDARIGFAVSSPVLLMEGGDREISLVIEVSNESIAQLKQLMAEVKEHYSLSDADTFYKVFTRAFTIKITGIKGWHEITDYLAESSYTSPIAGNILLIKMYLDAGFPAVVGFNPLLHTSGSDAFNTDYPVIAISINSNNAVYPYSFVAPLVIKRMKITVDVKGLQVFSAFNEHGPLNTSKPFYPFGNNPDVGSFLMIGQKEVFYKHLEQLGFRIEWQGLPKEEFGFTEYYEGYPEKVVNESFQCKLIVLKNGHWIPATEAERQDILLFRSVNSTGPVFDYSVQPITEIDYIDIEKIRLPTARAVDFTGLPAYSNSSKRGFIKFELVAPAMGFGIDEYPILVSEAIIKKAKKDPDVKTVNKPYVPVIDKLLINYTASTDINFANYQQSLRDGNTFYHLSPFGLRAMDAYMLAGDIHLVPPQYDNGGHIYIGLKNLKAPQTVSLLFQFLEKADEFAQYESTSKLGWRYLKDNRWEEFRPDQLLSDTTNGLRKSGIVKLDIPEEINTSNTILPAAYYWLKITNAGNADKTPPLLAIYTQVVAAGRVVTAEGIANGHIILPGVIKMLYKKVPNIAEVLQPFTSFGGRRPDGDTEKYMRMAERMRHKKRASNAWDYERMILDRFPEVFKAQCLHWFDPTTGKKELKIVLFPEMFNNNRYDLLQPSFSNTYLQQVEDYLSDYTSVFSRPHVINPHYEVIKVVSRIRFVRGYGNGYYVQKLGDAVTAWLSPWLNTEKSNVMFGGPLDISALAAFLSNIDYVDHVENLAVIKISNENKVYDMSIMKPGGEAMVVKPLHPWSLLTSADSHRLSIAEGKDDDTTPDETGMNYFSIADDFIITS